AYTDALAAVAHGDGGARAYAKFQEAESRAAGWWTLLREIVVFSIPAAAVSDVPGAGREQLRRAYRFLDRYPSPWALAQTRRFDGIVTALEGRPDEGRRLLEASIATFELASDVPDALMSRLMLHAIERGLGEAGAVEGLSEARAALARIGVRPPEMLEQNQERLALALASRAPRARAASEVGLVERLEGLVERVASRGTSAPLLEREVGSVVRALLAGREVRIERRGAEVRADCTWFEVPDGAGGELLVGVEGEVDDATRAALTILAAVAGLALENATLRGLGRAPAAGPTESASFVAASAAMKKLSSEIARMAQSRATVVIHGESGSGKEVVARAIHARSSRAGAELVAFNCAAVPRELFEGQLFGYKRGAFTGAVKDSPGVVRAAAGGTLFLDEIGELPPEVQPKLLRFLENGEVLPLGEERPVVVDVRVIAATHRDLFALVREGRFREDLYYRLQVVPLRVPPLRERREDVLPLARHFMGQLVPDGASPPVLAPYSVYAL
ncbi:MAG: sigma-54 factor interaction domain-containing protein, partial [Myxococcales bacterium]|nr:sigma-54 factor interaction domain-containing protein [Myxococcales bacterium]